MKFYNELEKILKATTPDKKFALFFEFYKAYKNGNFSFEQSYMPLEFHHPSYSEICTIVSPQIVPRRSNLTTKEGQINLLHAIAHIEYSAVDLALDGAYRFIGLPKRYYDDWLEVAEDEIRHFLLLETLLKELGATYGDIAVHDSLFEASCKTQTLLERMAVVPRYLEANGLDATPLILTKLDKLPSNAMIEKIKEALAIILEEEIAHVKKGDVWFEYACKKENHTKDIYFDIIEKYYPQGFLRAKNLNAEARKEAGFSCVELNFIAKRELC